MEIISPVLVMIVLGMLCRQWQLLNKNGIDNMKYLVTNIMLPVAIFHALATSDYGTETAKLVGIMFVMLVVSFCIGFLMKPLMTEHYRKYLPSYHSQNPKKHCQARHKDCFIQGECLPLQTK